REARRRILERTCELFHDFRWFFDLFDGSPRVGDAPFQRADGIRCWHAGPVKGVGIGFRDFDRRVDLSWSDPADEIGCFRPGHAAADGLQERAAVGGWRLPLIYTP